MDVRYFIEGKSEEKDIIAIISFVSFFKNWKAQRREKVCVKKSRKNVYYEITFASLH